MRWPRDRFRRRTAGRTPTPPARCAPSPTLRLRVDPAAVPVRRQLAGTRLPGTAGGGGQGAAAGAESPGALRDLAVYDLGTGRVVSLVWFPHASARRAGEPIIPLSEASSRAEEHLRRAPPRREARPRGRPALPGERPGERLLRGRASRTPRRRSPSSRRRCASCSTPPPGISSASTPTRSGSRRRGAGAARLSRKAAERIAAAALASRDLVPHLGAGAAVGKVAAAELFVVRPNDWLGAAPGERRRGPRRLGRPVHPRQRPRPAPFTGSSSTPPRGGCSGNRMIRAYARIQQSSTDIAGQGMRRGLQEMTGLPPLIRALRADLTR